MAGNPATVPIQERDVLHRMQTTVGGQFLISVIISRLPPPSDGPVIAPASAAVAAATGTDAAPQHQLMLQDAAAGESSGMKRKRQTRHCRRCGVQGCPGGYKRTNCPLYVPGEEFAATEATPAAVHPAAIAQAVMAGEGTSTTLNLSAGKKQRKPRTCRICGRQTCPGNSNRKLCVDKPADSVDNTTLTTPGSGRRDTTSPTGDGRNNDDNPVANASSIVQDDGYEGNQESEQEAAESKDDDDDDAAEKPSDASSDNEADV